jgi:histone-lysine N-methyltransferase SETMAR
LKWVPHLLTCDLKRKRVDLSTELLEILRHEEGSGFHRVITGDESWFYLHYSSNHIWACATDNVRQRASHQIQSEKLMLTVLWSTKGRFVVKWMERCERFNTRYFINENINELAVNLKRRGEFPDKRWYRLHLNNARPRNSHDSVDYIDRQQFVRLPHPPYSPDFAPSDFYRSGNVKQRLAK